MRPVNIELEDENLLVRIKGKLSGNKLLDVELDINTDFLSQHRFTSKTNFVKLWSRKAIIATTTLFKAGFRELSGGVVKVDVEFDAYPSLISYRTFSINTMTKNEYMELKGRDKEREGKIKVLSRSGKTYLVYNEYTYESWMPEHPPKGWELHIHTSTPEIRSSTLVKLLEKLGVTRNELVKLRRKLEKNKKKKWNSKLDS